MEYGNKVRLYLTLILLQIQLTKGHTLKNAGQKFAFSSKFDLNLFHEHVINSLHNEFSLGNKKHSVCKFCWSRQGKYFGTANAV